jgi:hypothetical protein
VNEGIQFAHIAIIQNFSKAKGNVEFYIMILYLFIHSNPLSMGMNITKEMCTVPISLPNADELMIVPKAQTQYIHQSP